MDRQQCQADAGLTGGCRDALCHLRQIVIRRAVRLMVEIVELHIGGITCFQHFHLHQRRDRLDMVGRQAVEEAVHQLPPCPEGIGSIAAAHFGQARHGALKGVAVGIGRGRQQYAGPISTGRLRLACSEKLDGAVRADFDRNGLCPTVFQQCLFGP